MAEREQFDEMLAYWRDLQKDAGGAIPRRTQFNPMAIPKLLPQIFMLECVGPDELIVRLTGTALDDATSRRPTGSNLLDRYDPVERETHKEMYANVLGQPCGVRVERLVHLPPDPVRRAKVISLPLADREGVIRYAVGSIALRSYHHEVDKEALHRLNITYLDLGFGTPGAGV